ncbi:MAG: trypsin-like peptidase domain-containing protein, partial [Candidatus Paceibacterota bacterium]
MKKYLTILIVSVLIIPQIALAAWWNPFSWFKKSSAFPTAKITQVASTTSTTSQIKEKPTTNINTNTSIPKSVPVKPKVVLPIKLTNAEIIKKVKPAVVYINTKDGSGSGMIIASDGYVLTNAHVVKGSQNADISIFSGSTFSASVIGRDEEVDVAILKIVSDQKFSTVELADSDKVMQGDNVFTLGYPFGIKGDVSFKEGTISRRIEDYFETSAEIHPGNSGGPLVNIYGQVIGINSASYGNSVQGVQVGETIKLAIPVNTAKNIIPDLKNGRSIIIPELSDSKPSTTKTNADLKSEYTTFRNKLFQ